MLYVQIMVCRKKRRYRGPRWRSWLRHCATSQKVAGSIPDGVIDIILLAVLWPWGRLSLWQKWVPGIFPGGKKRPVRRADNLTTFMCRLSWNLGASTYWNPLGLFRPVMGLLYLYFLHIYSIVSLYTAICSYLKHLETGSIESKHVADNCKHSEFSPPKKILFYYFYSMLLHYYVN